MRILAAIIGVLTAFIQAHAQEVNLSEYAIRKGHEYTYKDSPQDQYKHILYRTVVPGGVTAIIGLKRISGSGNDNLEVGTGFKPNTKERAQITGLIQRSANSNGNNTDIVMIPPSIYEKTYYVQTYMEDYGYGKWRIRVAHFDILGEAVSALAQAGIQCLFSNCTSTKAPSSEDEWTGRLLGLGMSALQSRTICSFGVNALSNEIQSQMAKEFPDNRFMQFAAFNFMSSYVGKISDVSCGY